MLDGARTPSSSRAPRRPHTPITFESEAEKPTRAPSRAKKTDAETEETPARTRGGRRRGGGRRGAAEPDDAVDAEPTRTTTTDADAEAAEGDAAREEEDAPRLARRPAPQEEAGRSGSAEALPRANGDEPEADRGARAGSRRAEGGDPSPRARARSRTRTPRIHVPDGRARRGRHGRAATNGAEPRRGGRRGVPTRRTRSPEVADGRWRGTGEEEDPPRHAWRQEPQAQAGRRDRDGRRRREDGRRGGRHRRPGRSAEPAVDEVEPRGQAERAEPAEAIARRARGRGASSATCRCRSGSTTSSASSRGRTPFGFATIRRLAGVPARVFHAYELRDHLRRRQAVHRP